MQTPLLDSQDRRFSESSQHNDHDHDHSHSDHNHAGSRRSVKLRQRSRHQYALLVCATALFVLLVSSTYHHSGDVGLHPAHLEHLVSTSTDALKSTVGNETTYIVGEHHDVHADYPDDYEWEEPVSRQPFGQALVSNGGNNNAFGRMPAGSPYDVLVVGRGLRDKYYDEDKREYLINLTVVGSVAWSLMTSDVQSLTLKDVSHCSFFANYDSEAGEWVRAGPEPYVLDIPVWRRFPRACTHPHAGGADPRFIWSDAGEPLIVVGTSSQISGVCKSMGMVDLRAVWPDLQEHLEEIGQGHVPIQFDTFTEIGRAGMQAPEFNEKNWAPFFPGPKSHILDHGGWYPKWLSLSRSAIGLASPVGPQRTPWPLLATAIKDRSIVEVDESLDTSSRTDGPYVMGREVDLTIHSQSGTTRADSSCIIRNIPETWDPDHLHQATPFHRVTFCNRGTCVPTERNTVLLGLIHYKVASKIYRR